MPNVIVKNRSQVFGYYDHNMLVMSEKLSDHLPKTKKYNPKQRLWYIRAKEVLISSGSIERPLVFGNNDTPGTKASISLLKVVLFPDWDAKCIVGVQKPDTQIQSQLIFSKTPMSFLLSEILAISAAFTFL